MDNRNCSPVMEPFWAVDWLLVVLSLLFSCKINLSRSKHKPLKIYFFPFCDRNFKNLCHGEYMPFLNSSNLSLVRSKYPSFSSCSLISSSVKSK